MNKGINHPHVTTIRILLVAEPESCQMCCTGTLLESLAGMLFQNRWLIRGLCSYPFIGVACAGTLSDFVRDAPKDGHFIFDIINLVANRVNMLHAVAT
jgi:hypothetical protein